MKLDMLANEMSNLLRSGWFFVAVSQAPPQALHLIIIVTTEYV